MLHLIVRLDGAAYALDASRIVQILPLLNFLKVAHPLVRIAGTINYRGEVVPLIDLASMTLGRPSRVRLSTRIVLARRGPSGDLIGLIAENATELQRIAPAAFTSNGLADQGPGFLGAVAIGPQGPIQRIEWDRLMSGDGEQSPLRAA